MRHLHKVALATALALSASANADVRVNGFANLVAGYSDTDSSLFDYEDSVDFSTDSLFALQLSGDITDKLTATGQIVARGADDYKADFEWAYLTYTVSDNLDISAGRLRLPLFLYSESLDVGYSYHWITAPNPVYSIAFNNIDGVKAAYTGYAGGWDYTLTASYGVINTPDFALDAGQTADIKGDNTILVSAEIVKDAFRARVAYGQAKATLTVAAVDQILASFAPLAPELADSLAFNDDTGVFYGASIGYDNFDWFVAAEYTLNSNDDTFFPDDHAYYITAGFRQGAWTPSITWQKRDGEDELKFLDQLAALPQPIQEAIAPAVMGIQMSQLENWNNWTLGLRYDWSTQTALKAEFITYEDDLDDSNDANLIRFAINYVF
uniref:porin n=1 Tax=Ningiella ruwaisensis TaxID=2364274 RepID=UPI0010A0923C|nr:porin [Ningiella ruwaisensis]